MVCVESRSKSRPLLCALVTKCSFVMAWCQIYYNKWQRFFPRGTKMHSDWLDKPREIFLRTHSDDRRIDGRPLLQILCPFYLFLTLSLASAFWCLGFTEEAHGLTMHLLCTTLLSRFHPANSDLFFPSHALSFWAHISEPYGSVGWMQNADQLNTLWMWRVADILEISGILCNSALRARAKQWIFPTVRDLPLFETLNSPMDSSQNILTTPQRHQQRARQAFRQLSQNDEESPRRRLPTPAPETPTPQPGYAKRTRANNRTSNREACNMELLNSPRRRRASRQDENVPRTNSAVTLGGQTVRSELNLLCFLCWCSFYFKPSMPTHVNCDNGWAMFLILAESHIKFEQQFEFS